MEISMKKFIFTILSFLCLTGIAHADVLLGEWVDGTTRYCKYSDGSVVTVDAGSVCPSYK